jgi:endo-1,4-beta-xylanase
MKTISVRIKVKSLTDFQLRSLIHLIERTGFRIIFLIVPFFLFTAYDVFPQEKPSLKDTFKNKFLIGAAINTAQILGKDTLGCSIITSQFNSISPENVLKWERVHPFPDKYNFDLADKYVEFGEKNDMFIIGHTLVWHSQTPRWVFQDSNGSFTNREELLKRMHNHIQTVVGRYKGKIKGWDVVNEALNEDGSLRESPWMKIIGEDYIEKAFQFAHEADPGAELYYNDYSLENKPKRDGAIKLIKKLKAEGIPVTGIGDQMHAKMDWPSASQVDSMLTDFGKLGIKVMITEMDIDVLPYKHDNHTAEVTLKYEISKDLNPYKSGLPDSVNTALADRYAEFFKMFIKHSSIISRVTFWGVRDGDSWLNYWPVMGRSNYPLVFDREGKPKPAFYKIIDAAGNNE